MRQTCGSAVSLPQGTHVNAGRSNYMFTPNSFARLQMPATIAPSFNIFYHTCGKLKTLQFLAFPQWLDYPNTKLCLFNLEPTCQAAILKPFHRSNSSNYVANSTSLGTVKYLTCLSASEHWLCTHWLA